MYDYLDLRQTERLKELVPYKVLAPDADEIIKELERLNNIINELENTITNFIENHTESYIDWKYDREIYLAESNVLQKLFDTYLDKLKELKDSD